MRGTLRDTGRGEALKANSAKHSDRIDILEIVTADPMDEASWVEAAGNCDDILHITSPVLVVQPADENEVFVPAKTGTLN